MSFVDQSFETDKLIVTFFPEVMDKLVDEGKITLERTIGGVFIPLYRTFKIYIYKSRNY